MASRTLYFLRDSITGRYYINAHNSLESYGQDGAISTAGRTFENAVIHTTENSIFVGMKSRVRSFKRDLAISDEDIKLSPYRHFVRELAREREELPNFGIEIVKVVIDDGVKKASNLWGIIPSTPRGFSL
jgi:hypothetical protein